MTQVPGLAGVAAFTGFVFRPSFRTLNFRASGMGGACFGCAGCLAISKLPIFRPICTGFAAGLASSLAASLGIGNCLAGATAGLAAGLGKCLGGLALRPGLTTPLGCEGAAQSTLMGLANGFCGKSRQYSAPSRPPDTVSEYTKKSTKLPGFRLWPAATSFCLTTSPWLCLNGCSIGLSGRIHPSSPCHRTTCPAMRPHFTRVRGADFGSMEAHFTFFA
mmetsp:Transcript_2635/g.6170  ORF Transcript_2635/g.6170 Transcript_2635/m.6170 type:complete len:219 (-) Transcript_2635:7-663(-)